MLANDVRFSRPMVNTGGGTSSSIGRNAFESMRIGHLSSDCHHFLVSLYSRRPRAGCRMLALQQKQPRRPCVAPQVYSDRRSAPKPEPSISMPTFDRKCMARPNKMQKFQNFIRIVCPWMSGIGIDTLGRQMLMMVCNALACGPRCLDGWALVTAVTQGCFLSARIRPNKREIKHYTWYHDTTIPP